VKPRLQALKIKAALYRCFVGVKIDNKMDTTYLVFGFVLVIAERLDPEM
jgi:hypothetical protein